MSTERHSRPGLIRSRGFALLIVLWALALAALIAAQVTALGRRETLIAANLRDAGTAEAAADGAVEETIFRLMRNEAGWDADGTPRTILVGQIPVTVVIADDRGKVNINNAAPDQLMNLLLSLGEQKDRAQELTTAIVAWRGGDASPGAADAWRERYRGAGLDYAPPFQPFETMDELSLVLGMTSDLYELLAPRITIYEGASTVTIEARAAGPRGASFGRRAVVRLSGRDGYSILAWDRG